MRAVAALIILAALAMAGAPALAHDCATWTGECAFEEVVRFGGPAPTRVHEPSDVAAAADGRVAVADSGAERALVLDRTGSPLFTAEADHGFNVVTFGPDGDLWAAGPGRIRRFGPDGRLKAEITERLLRGAPGNQSYAGVHGMAVDGDGRLYAAAADVLLIYGADGRLEREVTRPTPGGFTRDWLIGAHQGRVLVSNLDAGTVEQLDRAGNVTATLAAQPEGVWPPASDVDRDGRLFLAGTSETWIYDRTLAKVGSVPRGHPGLGGGMAATAGTLIFADPNGDRLARFDHSGAALPAWGTTPAAGLNRPTSVEVSDAGEAVVADARNHRVVRFDATGKLQRILRDFGAEGSTTPLAVALNDAGETYVTYDDGHVERLAADGAVLASWPVPDAVHLRGIAVAPDQTVWVRDRHRLLRYSPAGSPLRQLDAGLASTYASGNGLAVDATGNLYAAQPRSIRKLTPEGALVREYDAQLAEGVEVLPGGAIAVATQGAIVLMDAEGKLIASWGDHGTPAGRLALPFDVGADAAGRFYVAARQAHGIFRFTFARPGTRAPSLSGPPPPVPIPLRLSPAPRSGLKVTRAGTTRVRLSCGTTGPRCAGRLQLSRRGRSGSGTARVPRILGSARFDLGAGRSKHVTVRLAAPARSALRAAGRLRIDLVAKLADATEVRRAVLLRAAR